MTVALPARLVEQHGRGDRHVQAVGDAAHREADGLDVGPRPGVGQAVGLGAQDDRDRPGQVGVGVGPLGVDARGDDPEARARAARRATSVGRRGRERDAEDRPGAGPDRVRVEQVGPRRGGDERVGAGAVGRAQDRAEVAGLLDALDDDDERVRRERQVGRARGRGIRTTATSPSARSPKASFSKTRLADRRDRRAAALAAASSAARASGPASSGSQTNASTTLDAGVERPADLARAVDEGQARAARARAGRAAPRPR